MKIFSLRNTCLLGSLALFLNPSSAHAHIITGETGFTHGFHHPIHGLDHILAMIAVGLWAAQMGGRALWVVPTTFVSVMILGGTLGIAGINLPLVEQGILASLFILGLLIATAARFSPSISSVIVSLFALCHGHAHGVEMPHDASALQFAFGFAIATTLLHGMGIVLGMSAQRFLSAPTLRWTGCTIILGGFYLTFV